MCIILIFIEDIKLYALYLDLNLKYTKLEPYLFDLTLIWTVMFWKPLIVLSHWPLKLIP